MPRTRAEQRVRKKSGIKGGGRKRPRPSHNAPQCGAFQGLPGFGTWAYAGVTFEPRGSLRGLVLRKCPWLAAFSGGQRGGTGKNREFEWAKKWMLHSASATPEQAEFLACQHIGHRKNWGTVYNKRAVAQCWRRLRIAPVSSKKRPAPLSKNMCLF